MNGLRRFKGLIVFSLVMICLFGALVVGKNIFLRQARKKIQSLFTYSRFRISYFPPAVILDDVQTVSPSPSFTARQVTFQISYLSVLSKEKPLTVLIDRPVIKFSEPSGDHRKEKRTAFWPLPLAIEKGLLRDGEIYYKSRTGDVRGKKIKALFTQKGDIFTLHVESGQTVFMLSSGGRSFNGTASLSVSGKRSEVTIHKALVEGPDFFVKAEGKLQNPLQPVLELRTAFNVEISSLMPLLDIPFRWEGRAEGRGRFQTKGGEIFFDSELKSRDIILNHIPLGEVAGRLSLQGKAGGGVELSLQKKNLSSEFVRIRFGKGRIEGQVRGARLDPIMSYAVVPWPVRSPVWGSFVIEKRKLTSEGEFKDNLETTEPSRFPFIGKVVFDMDLSAREFSFSSPELNSTFMRADVRGRVHIGRDVDVEIKGEIKDVVQARAFTSLILGRNFGFSEIRGQGTAEIRISGDYKEPQTAISFSCRPGGFDKFDASAVEGNLEILKGQALGRFRVDDRNFKGEIGLISEGGRTQADFRISDGNIENILRTLDIILPLQGRASAELKLVQDGRNLEVNGEFTSPKIDLLGQPARNVKGRLEWKDGSLSFTGLSLALYGGTVSGSLFLRFPGWEFNIDLAGKDMDLLRIQPGLQGKLIGDLKGSGVFGKDRPKGRFEIQDLVYSPFSPTEARGEWDFDYLGDAVNLDVRGGFLPGPNEFRLVFHLPLHEDSISVDIKGRFENFDLLLPWKGAKGRLNYLGEIRGSLSAPRLNGAIDLQGSLLPLPRFAHALNDFTGLAFVKNGKISIRSFQGKLGGGDIQGTGEIGLGAKGVETIDIRMDGKNMLLSLVERMRALTEGSLRLIKDSRQFVLEGDFNISRLSWRREVFERLGLSSSPPQARREKGFFDDLALNLKLRAAENAWMENSLGRVNGRLDLTVTGNINSPLLQGDIEALGGEVYFQDRTFKVLRGRLNFFNPNASEPYLDFRGETYVKDYRVTFTLNGLINSLKPEFTSSPPLPPEDVLALLTLGEAFQRTYSYDTSTQLSTASLLSFQIAEQAQKRAEGLFSLARFRIDPFVMGSSAEMTARLTVGRQISRNLSMLYSTNLTTQRQEIIRMEWEISNDFSLVGMRNEWGRMSIDVKVRKRF